MQNHTATHVMNWALREVLGNHVQQKGSLVDPDKTRFDLSHPKALTPEEIERVESLVNERIGQKLTVYDEPVKQEQALKIHGLRAVFGEKYPDEVRVMSIGTPVSELVANPDNPEWRNVSIEFCGGTHCQNTGQIGHFAIVSEEAVAKGIRRVVGITGEAARAAIDRGAELLKQADDLRRVGTAHQGVAAGGSPAGASGNTPAPKPGAAMPHSPQPGAAMPHADLATQVAELQQTIADETLRVVDRAKLRDAIAELQKVIKKQQKLEAAAVQDVVTDRINELLAGAPKVGETTIFVAEMPDVPTDQLKTGADMIKQKCGSAAVLFGVKGDGKALLLAAMSNDLVKRGLKAGDLVKAVAKLIKGGGGGPPTMAQAGGKDPNGVARALSAGREWIEERLG
jgi:alanyl-tRNA synthetase